jgi:type IV pilus assembly protein PilX
MVLVASLLLLLIVTIMAVSMFRSSGVQERIAGNMREKQRALQAATTAQQYAEWWLTQNGNAATAPVVCNALLDANLNQGQICSNRLSTALGGPANVGNIPWQIAGVDVGVLVKPPGMNVVAAAAWNTYAISPRFYISDIGPSADALVPGEVFEIDAVGYGGANTTAAVVESTYAVYVNSSNRTL